MNFTFSENKALHFDTIKNFTRDGARINYSLIDILNPLDNQIKIDNIDYFFTYLSDDGKNKGGNSIILKLFESQTIDVTNTNYGKPDLIIKILKYKKAWKPLYEKKSEKRFKMEIEGLKKCKEANFQNVVNIFHNGVCKVFNPDRNAYDEFLYYTMEYAEYDLKKFIEINHEEFSFDEKLNLSISIAEGLKELESLNYFHRDIKPDNIFMTESIWKIGDLGLLDERNKLDLIDDEAEPIGPRGWMSPESMNKYLTEGKKFKNNFNVSIDHQSDIFQLGKVFWYIFQHNAPIGAIKERDFKINNSQIYSIIRTMLNHSKENRFKRIDEVIKLLKTVQAKTLKEGVI